MNVCFDLDYTLAAPMVPFWEVASEMTGIPFGVPPKSWGFPEYPEKLASECNKLFRQDWYMNGVLRPERSAKNMLLHLAKMGHTIYIVTARQREVRNGTYKWITKNFFPGYIKDILFVEYGVGKGEILESLRADVWVDDKPEDCWATSQRGIHTFMITRPWNDNNDTSDLITRCDSLDAVYRGLKEIKGFN